METDPTTTEAPAAAVSLIPEEACVASNNPSASILNPKDIVNERAQTEVEEQGSIAPKPTAKQGALKSSAKKNEATPQSSFLKGDILIECYIRRVTQAKTRTGKDTWREKTLLFDLVETPMRTKESFDELEDTVYVRICVATSNTKNKKTVVVSVDDGSGLGTAAILP